MTKQDDKKKKTKGSQLLKYIDVFNIRESLEAHLPWNAPSNPTVHYDTTIRNIVISVKFTNQNGEMAFPDKMGAASRDLHPILCKGVDHPHYVSYNSMGSRSTHHPHDINRPGAQSIYQHAIDTNTWIQFVKLRTGIRLHFDSIEESIVNTVISIAVPETFNFDKLQQIVKPSCHIEHEKIMADDDMQMLNLMENESTGGIPHYCISLRVPEDVITPSQNKVTLKIFISEKGTVFFINGFRSPRVGVVVLSDFVDFVMEHAVELECSNVSNENKVNFAKRRAREQFVKQIQKVKK